MYEVQIRLVRSKLSTWLPAYQPVYFLCTMAFYNTDFWLWPLYSWPWQYKKMTYSLLLRSCGCGCSFSRWNYRPRVHSWDDSCQSVPSGIILNVLYVMSVWAQASQNSSTVHNFFSTSDIVMISPCDPRVPLSIMKKNICEHPLSRINVLICIPHTWPAAVDTWKAGQCRDIVFSPSHSSHRKQRMACKINWQHTTTLP